MGLFAGAGLGWGMQLKGFPKKFKSAPDWRRDGSRGANAWATTIGTTTRNQLWPAAATTNCARLIGSSSIACSSHALDRSDSDTFKRSARVCETAKDVRPPIWDWVGLFFVLPACLTDCPVQAQPTLQTFGFEQSQTLPSTCIGRSQSAAATH